LIFDLNGDGVQTIGLAAGVKFDLTGSGIASNVGWASAQDGFLALDLNHDGIINNGTELFGQGTTLADGTKAATGYQALAELDSNHDGVIDAGDAQYNQLGVWVDANVDGVTQAGELHSLTDLNIASISLDAQKTSIFDQGNWIGLESSYTTTDGTQHALADVWLQLNQDQSRSVDLANADPSVVAAGALAQIDMAQNGIQDTLTISTQDVQVFGQKDLVVNDQTGEGNLQMMVRGDAVDVVHLTGPQGQWADAGTTLVDGEMYHILQHDNLQLLVGVNMHHDPTI
jgi:hypothetical protein